MTAWRLVADVGGTNVRFAETAAGTGQVAGVRAYTLRDFAAFPDAVARYLADTQKLQTPPDEMVIGAAGPVSEHRVTLTNAPWSISAFDLQDVLDPRRVAIINDLQSVALFLPRLLPGDIESIRGNMQAGPANAPRLAVNVGTGFGAAVAHAVDSGGETRWHAFSSEAGHMTIGTAGHQPVDGDGVATIEDLISGAGIVAEASRLSDRPTAFTSSHDLFAAATPDSLRQSIAQRIGTALGIASRNLVLAHGAWGGVCFVGSVARVLMDNAAPVYESVLKGFDVDPTGPMVDRLAKVPIALITRENPELAGLSYYTFSG